MIKIVKCFHATAKAKAKINHIKMLIDEEGRVLDWDIGLQDMMIKYFESLFVASDTEWAEVVDCIPSSIAYEQNEKLL